MLLMVALSVVSVVLVESSSGMSESELPASASSAFSAASVCGSSSPRSAISCFRTLLMPEIPSDSTFSPLFIDCRVSSMLDSPSYRLSPESPSRSLISRRSDRISSEESVAGAMNSSSPMLSKLSEPIRTVKVFSSPGSPMNTTSLYVPMDCICAPGASMESTLLISMPVPQISIILFL